jgi:hypothetical protein
MLSFFGVTAFAAVDTVYGDMNDDSVVNSDDAIYLLKHTMLPSEYPISQSADVDGTGDVNISDAKYLLKHATLPSGYPILSPRTHYTVTWTNDDGTVLKTTLCEVDAIPSFGSQTPQKPSDAKHNYTFSDWSPKLTKVTGEATYVAVYQETTRTSYTISYDAVGGKNAPASQKKTADAAVKLSTAIPTKSGKVFTGWYCVNDGKTYAAGASFSLNQDAVLCALWGDSCGTCAGNGSWNYTGQCEVCIGVGKVEEKYAVSVNCLVCGGTGMGVCSRCSGAGGMLKCECTCGNVWFLNNGGDRECDNCGKVVTAHRTITCGWCSGSGMGSSSCAMCSGDGKVFDPRVEIITCSNCDGKGRGTFTKICSSCGGQKAIVTYDTYTITLMDGDLVISTKSVSVKSSYQLTVPTKDGYTFLGWYDAPSHGNRYADASGKPLSVWLELSDKTLYAHWIQNCDLILTQNISEAGTVTGGGNYAYGSSVTVKATVNNGYTFLGWYINNRLVSSSLSYTLNLYGNSVLQAKWQPKTYTISTSRNLSDGGTVSGGGNHTFGRTVDLIATTNEGYTFLGWYENGALLSSSEIYTFKATTDRAIEARWRINTYTVSITRNISDGGSAIGDRSYNYGTSVTVTASTNAGYTFLGWYLSDSLVSIDESYTFIVSRDTALVAKWTKNHDVVLQKNIYCAGSVTGEGNFVPNSTVTVTAITNNGYIFLGWYENGMEVCSEESYTFDVSADKTLVATWKLKEEYAALSDFAFELTTWRCEITDVIDKTKTEYIIPDYVTSIGFYAFENCTNFTSIKIPNGVTSIGGSAFKNCTSLASIEIPDSVTSIYSSAFAGCTSLTSIEIPNGVTFIGGFAFENCTSLTSIEIPNGVTSIDSYAFYGCTSLTSIEIPNSVTSIGYSAFENCTSLMSIEIPNSVTSIGYSAFENCTSLTSIEIPNGVTSIDSYAFDNCTSLMSIEIPNSVTSIGYSAFKNCTSLTSIEIPNSVTSIGWSAFYGCTSLMSIEIPNSVTSIDSYAFDNCTSLMSIEIPNSVTSIGFSAFENCTSLTAVYISDIASWCNISFGDNPLYYAKNLYLNGELVTALVIPDGVTSISRGAFRKCTSLTSVVFPDSVTSIDDYAFYDCTNLTSIEFSNSLTSIGSYAFYDCTSLTSIEIPDSVTTISKYAFYECTNLMSVTLGKNVSSIGMDAFYLCKRLVEIINHSALTIKKGGASFGRIAENVIEIHDGASKITALGNFVFYEYGGVNYLIGYAGTDTELTLPATYKGQRYVINKYAFCEYSDLVSVVIPNSVTSIGNYAFYYCKNLTSIEYCGTSSQWQSLSKGAYWDSGAGRNTAAGSYAIIYN